MFDINVSELDTDSAKKLTEKGDFLHAFERLSSADKVKFWNIVKGRVIKTPTEFRPVQNESHVIRKAIMSDNKESAPVSTPPSLMDKASAFASAVSEWSSKGYPVVSSETFWERVSICRGCEFWSEVGQTGVGKCGKCGCSSGKHWLATSRCPLDPPKWSRVA